MDKVNEKRWSTKQAYDMEQAYDMDSPPMRVGLSKLFANSFKSGHDESRVPISHRKTARNMRLLLSEGKGHGAYLPVPSATSKRSINSETPNEICPQDRVAMIGGNTANKIKNSS